LLGRGVGRTPLGRADPHASGIARTDPDAGWRLTYLRRVGEWIGTSGWSYDHWQDVEYHGCSPADRLRRYIAEFDTVELNASFHRWPRDAAFTSWQRRLPAGFRLSVKAPRALTHARKLYAPEYWVRRITATWDRL
jgi:hypothetical protein